ncbi:creatine kinase B-type-like [Saccoglossus kowalevskii]|uniref:Creatine kinase B-type-like n=1 Tax=Saccoglossus kowalevskii TaxID=10224 RepID=A0ABM0LVN7_SACKO|nr:PREDICTED: creatine kinase B-type-like [Saccoglossus kowalevskii]
MANQNQKRYPAQSDFPDLSKSNALLKDYLTQDIYAKLRDVRTSSGFTFDRAIQHCLDRVTETIGIVAGDEDSYTVFADIFGPVIERYHKIVRAECMNVTDLSPEKITGEIFDENYVVSTRIRASRNIRGFCLPPFCCRSERRAVERSIVCALNSFPGGEYHPLSTMDDALCKSLMSNHYLFRTPKVGFQLVSGCARDWPDARGIWYTEDKTLIFWVNEEDHMRVISMQPGGHVKEVFTRFCNAMKQVEQTLKIQNHQFMWRADLGYLSTEPANLGTGLRASVHVKLPNLSKHPRFYKILSSLKLECRGTAGYGSAIKDGICDISNSVRLGVSEVYLVQTWIDNVNLLIQIEMRLENIQPIDDLLPM